MSYQNQFKPVWRLITLITLALLMTACGGSSTPAPAEKPAESTVAKAEEKTAEEKPSEAATTDRCGDKAKLVKNINMFNWAQYMDPEILKQFEAECGVKVREDIFTSNEDMIAKVQAGNSGYDLVIPSDYAVDIMVRGDLLAELDRANIPNIKNLNPLQMGLYYDKENKFSLPYQWNITGIAYNVKTFPTPPDSWALLFDPKQLCEHKGFASMLEDERESIGAALKFLGYSYNDTDAAHHEEAKKILLGQKECIAGYNSDSVNQTLAGEEILFAHAWAGMAAQARAENDNIKFIIAKEGGAIWQDNMAIPKDAPNKYTAEVFINYLLDPAIGAQLSNFTYYFTPNKAAEPLLSEMYHKILTEGGMMIDEETHKRLEWIERNDKSIIFSDTWTAVKAQ